MNEAKENEGEIGKNGEESEGIQKEGRRGNNQNRFEKLLTFGVLAVILILSLFQVYQINQLATNITGSFTAIKQTQKASSGVDDQSKIQQVYNEVIPEKGSETGYGLTYSQQGMNSLTEKFKTIKLSGEIKDRYIDLGSKQGTACEYCCGASSALRKNGQIACGCAHNYAIAGLIKYLVKETDFGDQEIQNEVQNWKAYFFPKQTLAKELEKRGISPTAAGLPQMRGGC